MLSPALISVIFGLITLAVNLVLVAFFLGGLKGRQEAHSARIAALEQANGGAAGSAASQATTAEKLAHIERQTAAIPELQLAMATLQAQFSASLRSQDERLDHIRGDYQQIIAGLAAKSAPLVPASKRTRTESN